MALILSRVIRASNPPRTVHRRRRQRRLDKRTPVGGRGRRGEKRTRGAQNLVGFAQLTNLTLEFSDTPGIIRARAGTGALVDLSALDPAPQRLGVHAQLVADALDRPGSGGRILPGLDRHPRGSLPQVVRIFPWCCHSSDPLLGDQSLQPTQDASTCCQVELRGLQR